MKRTYKTDTHCSDSSSKPVMRKPVILIPFIVRAPAFTRSNSSQHKSSLTLASVMESVNANQQWCQCTKIVALTPEDPCKVRRRLWMISPPLLYHLQPINPQWFLESGVNILKLLNLDVALLNGNSQLTLESQSCKDTVTQQCMVQRQR